MTQELANQVLQDLVYLLLVAFLTAGTWALQYVARRWKINLSDDQKQTFQDAVEKALDWATTRAVPALDAAGWDHRLESVRSPLINAAARYAVENFPDALRAVGVDPKNPEVAASQVRGALERSLPAAVTRARYSQPPSRAAAPPLTATTPAPLPGRVEPVSSQHPGGVT